jgi:hypothetical protein
MIVAAILCNFLQQDKEENREMGESDSMINYKTNKMHISNNNHLYHIISNS